MSTILLLCWRDQHHPQAGGSERYQLEIATRLSQLGHKIHIVTARYPQSARYEKINDIAYYRVGNRLSIYPLVFFRLFLSKFNCGFLKKIHPDIIIDTQNGIPFFATLLKIAPTIMLIHHCHKAQWPIAGKIMGTIGWFIESRLSPWMHRKNRYITVSQASKNTITQLGVPAEQISVIHAGVSLPSCTIAQDTDHLIDTIPQIHLSVLSRLVPHKQIEHAIDIIADLQYLYPQLHLDIIGDGWWREHLVNHAKSRQVTDHIQFHGFVSEADKFQILSRSHIHLMPSRAEGWCLAITEAATLGIPSIGYRYSGGLNDSIHHEQTGFVVDDYAEFREKVQFLLDNPNICTILGEAARAFSQQLNWDVSTQAFLKIIRDEIGLTASEYPQDSDYITSQRKPLNDADRQLIIN